MGTNHTTGGGPFLKDRKRTANSGNAQVRALPGHLQGSTRLGAGWREWEALGGALLREEEAPSHGMQVPLEAGRDEDKDPPPGASRGTGPARTCTLPRAAQGHLGSWRTKENKCALF